jgi:hypothetical protein
MSRTSETPNDPIKPVRESVTSGLTSFPGSGASELPPLPKARKIKAVLRALIFGIVGTGAGAVIGLLWGGVLSIVGADGEGTTGVGVGRIVISAAVCAMIGFIAGISDQPLETILGAILGAIAGAVLPAFLKLTEFMTTGAALLAIMGAMAGAYVGELRSEEHT